MRRRCVFAALALGFALWGADAGAQERVHRIGVLLSSELSAAVNNAWLEGLRERGYVDGGNLKIEYRFFGGRNERVPALAAELAASAPELIVALGGEAALAIRAAAPGIPLVFVSVVDPVGLGLIESLAHPG